MRGTWIRTAPAWAWIVAAIVALGPVVPALAGEEPDDAADPQTQTFKVVVKDGGASGKAATYLGVNLGEETDRPEGGARVESVLPESPAKKAGLRKGDVIVSFRDQAIHGPGALTKQIRNAKPGDKVPLGVLRDGKRETITVELGERKKDVVRLVLPGREDALVVPLPDLDEKNLQLELERSQAGLEETRKALEELKWVQEGHGRAPRAFAFSYAYGRPKLGIEMVSATPDLREFLGGPKDSGVIVGKVISPSAAEKAGLKVGDLVVSVDGEKIEDPSDLVQALEDKDGKTIELEVVRDRKTMKLRATLPEVEDEAPTGPRASLAPAALPEPPEPPEPPLPLAPPRPPAPVSHLCDAI